MQTGQTGTGSKRGLRRASGSAKTLRFDSAINPKIFRLLLFFSLIFFSPPSVSLSFRKRNFPFSLEIDHPNQVSHYSNVENFNLLVENTKPS